MNINRVKVKNFKSLVDIDLELKNLTIITGVNSSGKSSFIQSLLLFKENYDNILFEPSIRNNCHPDVKYTVKITPKKKFSFKGKYVNMGDSKILLSQNSSSDLMVFEIEKDKEILNITLEKNMEIKYNKESKFEILELFNDHKFSYLTTNRTSPASLFPFSKDINNNSIGIKGEYTTHFLSEYRHQKLKIDKLKHHDSHTSQLLENTEKWLGEISKGILIKASADESTQSSKLAYQYINKDTTSSEYSSLNVGFGLTYALPVIVLILKSKPNDLIIIENPESHLHPAGQSKIAELCAIASANGVQIIIETHSDHFVNGIRVATKQNIIRSNQSQIYYFKKEENELETKVDKINIGKDGSISDYPKGFFDQFDDDLDKLLDL
jgi:predicted ATPase